MASVPTREEEKENLVDVEKEGGEVEKEGGETKKRKRKGNKEDMRRQVDDSWMAGAISNGRVNLEERDPSWAPVRSPEAASCQITHKLCLRCHRLSTLQWPLPMGIVAKSVFASGSLFFEAEFS